jgi:hypothetical protein
MGAGFEPDMGILPTGTGLDRTRRLGWLVQPRCGCSLRLAGGRRFETEMPISRREHYLMNTTIEYQKVNYHLWISAIILSFFYIQGLL